MQRKLPKIVTILLLLGFAGTIGRGAEPEVKSLGKFANAIDIRKTPLRTRSMPDYRKLPITVEFWAKLPSTKMARYNLLVSNAPGTGTGHWEIYTTPLQGYLTAKISAFKPSMLESFVRITDDQWHYIAMTCDGKTVALFIDGKRVAAQKVAAIESMEKDEGELFVGYESKYVNESSSVSVVDELRISKVAREITSVPDKPFSLDKHTAGLWHFDETKGNRRVDSSSNTNSLAYSPGIDSAWTPRSSTRPDAEAWERETDADWNDGRFQKMEKGPTLGLSMRTSAALGNKEGPYAPKGMAIRVGDEQNATVLFDRAQMQICAAWIGGFLKIHDRRFALINHPDVQGDLVFSAPSQPGWEKPAGASDRQKSVGSPLPCDWATYEGSYLHGNKTILSYRIGGTPVLELPWIEKRRELVAVTRTCEIAPSKAPMRMVVAQSSEFKQSIRGDVKCFYVTPRNDKARTSIVFAVAPNDITSLSIADGRLIMTIAPHEKPTIAKLFISKGPWDLNFPPIFADLVKTRVTMTPPSKLTKGGLPRWTESITTKGELGDSSTSPLIIDTLSLPYENPYKSIFYVTGVGFLKDGKIAISTIYGDVWIAEPHDKELTEIKWTRFASGMYQPLGLVIKNQKIHVLERGQITCLHDLNNDGEADFYENVYNGWDTPGAGHAYDTGLKLAPDGSFYLFKGQAGGACRESGCLLRVAADASGHEIFSTGFRHPIGLGVSPDGIVTGGDQQGNWMPATRIDQYKKGGFYGDMRTHHRDKPPTTYDKPICWLPQYVDNSAGGQVSIPTGRWGPLGGGTVHFSWGRCLTYLLMRETVDEQVQGGVVQLPTEKFLGGPITGAFNPTDGCLYVAGMHGWQTACEKDGCLQRIRYTGNKIETPVQINARKSAIEIRFSRQLDPGSISNTRNFKIEQWNYRYSGNYGSDHWSVSNPNRMGHDQVAIASASLLDDGQTVQLRIPDLQPVMQMKIDYRIKAADGSPVAGTIHNTINVLK